MGELFANMFRLDVHAGIPEVWCLIRKSKLYAA
jgi:hypothetical protein